MDDKPTLSFSNVTLSKIEQYFDVEIIYSEAIFKGWFVYDYHLSNDDKEQLDKLIKKNRLKLHAYLEEKLKAKFIIPVLNLVEFHTGQLDDWYETVISYEFEHVILNGTADYLVASGSKVPKTPFFFLSKFKPTKPSNDPELQLLLQLIAALAINEANVIKGGFIISAQWFFASLRKVENKYIYYVSPAFDALIPEKLYQIFTNLQAVKAEALAYLAEDDNK